VRQLSIWRVAIKTVVCPTQSNSIIKKMNTATLTLPLLGLELAAIMGAVSEHVFPALILVGLATPFSVLARLSISPHNRMRA